MKCMKIVAIVIATIWILNTGYIAPIVAAEESAALQRVPNELKDFYLDDSDLTLETIEIINKGLITDDKSIAVDLNKKLAAIVQALPVGYSLMSKFDADVDAAPTDGTYSIWTSRSYKKLQIMRSHVADIEQQVAGSYAYLWMVYKGHIRGMIAPEIKERARNYIRGFHAAVYQETSKDSTRSISEKDAKVRRIAMHNTAAILYVLVKKLEEDIDSKNKDEAKMYADLKKLTARLHFTRSGDVSNGVDVVNAYNSNLLNLQNLANKMQNAELAQYLEQELKEIESGHEPNTSILVAGFKNTTGSEFAKHTWVLTFDDGPHTTNTKKIAKVLTDAGIKGDFFWLSKLVKSNPDIAKYIYDAGFGISSHSVDHADLTKVSTSKLTAQVSGSKETIEKTLHDEGATGYSMKDFRCPYGACWAPKSKNVQQAIVDAGLRHVYWAVDTLDWQDKNTASVLARTLKQMKAAERGIILFHDVHPVAEKVIPLLLVDKYVTGNSLKFLGL